MIGKGVGDMGSSDWLGLGGSWSLHQVLMSAMVSSLLVSWGCGQWGLLSWVWSWNITEVQMFSSFGWNFVLVWSLVNCTWIALLADFPSVLSVFLWFFPLSSSWPILERTSLKDLSPSFSFIKYMFSLEKKNQNCIYSHSSIFRWLYSTFLPVLLLP